MVLSLNEICVYCHDTTRVQYTIDTVTETDMKGKTLPFLEGIKSILFLKIKNIPWDVSLRDLCHQSRKFGLVKDFFITDRQAPNNRKDK